VLGDCDTTDDADDETSPSSTASMERKLPQSTSGGGGLADHIVVHDGVDIDGEEDHSVYRSKSIFVEVGLLVIDRRGSSKRSKSDFVYFLAQIEHRTRRHSRGNSRLPLDQQSVRQSRRHHSQAAKSFQAHKASSSAVTSSQRERQLVRQPSHSRHLSQELRLLVCACSFFRSLTTWSRDTEPDLTSRATHEEPRTVPRGGRRPLLTAVVVERHTRRTTETLRAGRVEDPIFRVQSW
jgi:hypothetical protein